jgi:membrane protease YdiL (CAAX protease family)
MGAAFLLALGLPLVVGTLAYGAAFLFNLAQFEPPPFPTEVSPAIAQFGVNLVFAVTVGLLILLPTAAGEEIGWRGYLLPRLIDARAPQPVLLTSLIWGAWHLPVVFAGVYAAGASPLLSAVMLMLATALFGSIIGWVRIETGSIWPVILAHALWNAIINGAFTPAAQEATARLWTGETGILVVLVLAPVTILVRRSWQPVQPVEKDAVYAPANPN